MRWRRISLHGCQKRNLFRHFYIDQAKSRFFSVCHSPFGNGGSDAGEPRPVDQVVGQDLDRLRSASQGPGAEVHGLERRNLLVGRLIVS